MCLRYAAADRYTDGTEAPKVTISIAPVPVPLSMDDTGTIRVGGTRLTLDTVLGAFERGDTPEEIIEGFPDLSLADVYAIIAYYFRYRQEVDEYLSAREAEAAEIRRKIEARQGKQPGREVLLARYAERQRQAQQPVE
jgi:uncharacterized protein (DUF433 family)